MNEIRPLASLTAGLLARKSVARPARTPVALAPLADKPVRRLSVVPESTGWSDHSRTPPSIEAVAELAAENCAPANDLAAAPSTPSTPSALPKARAPKSRAARPGASLAAVPDLALGRKVAFTLRIDPERHVGLRVACALRGRSAQSLLTEAIDRLVAEDPAVAEMVGKSVIPS